MQPQLLAVTTAQAPASPITSHPWALTLFLLSHPQCSLSLINGGKNILLRAEHQEQPLALHGCLNGNYMEEGKMKRVY